MSIKETLAEIVKIQNIIEIRAVQKYDASYDDWRSYSTNGIEYDENGATINLIENQSRYDGYPEHETVYLTLNEIEMTDDQWNIHLETLRKERDAEKLRKEEKKKLEELEAKKRDLAAYEQKVKDLKEQLGK